MIDRRNLMRFVGVVTVVACGPLPLVLASADNRAEPPDITDARHEIWRRESEEHHLDPLILFAISVHETGRRDPEQPLKPWPYSINTPKGPVYAADRAEAEKILAVWDNDDRLDIGLMQVNLGVHRSRVGTPHLLVDPATNVRIGAQILADAIKAESGDVWAGVGRYHSADSKRGPHYAAEVGKVFRRLKQELNGGPTAGVPMIEQGR